MNSIELPKLTFILGGAASGKSKFAERQVVQTHRPRTYLATARAYDTEMETKVAAHKAQRGANWTTIEAPISPWDDLAKIDPNGVVLLDCATFWLSNILLEGVDIVTNTATLLNGLQTCPAPLVVVSNEVGQGIVPDNALSRQFRQAQGELNQQIAHIAQLAVFITAGLPQTLKGTLPKGFT